MARVHFGHCVGCDQPIRPPYLSFIVSRTLGDVTWNWEEVDVCDVCANHLTANDLHRLVNAEEKAA